MVLLSSRGNRHLGIANIFLNVETYWFYLYDLCRLHLFMFFLQCSWRNLLQVFKYSLSRAVQIIAEKLLLGDLKEECFWFCAKAETLGNQERKSFLIE